MELNYLHRMSARLICALVWIHAGGRVSATIHSHVHALSIPPFRSQSGEYCFFLASHHIDVNSHIALALVTPLLTSGFDVVF